MVCLGKTHYKELQEKFHVKAMPDIEKGVAEMCNLSEGIYRDGLEAGMAQGM